MVLSEHCHGKPHGKILHCGHALLGSQLTTFSNFLNKCVIVALSPGKACGCHEVAETKSSRDVRKNLAPFKESLI